VVATWTSAVAVAGSAAAIAGAVADAGAARSAAAQTWPAFVLVCGLLLVGLVAAEEGLFEVAGERLAARAGDGRILYAGTAVLVAAVTAVLNLDTAVAFLTPVLVHTARRRGEDPVLLLSLCLLMANAASLLLPGSNLTNLIVLDGHHVPGGTFLVEMAPSWAAAVAATAVLTAAVDRLRARRAAILSAGPDFAHGRPTDKSTETVAPTRLHRGNGRVAVVAVAAVAVAVVALPSPAPVVGSIGVGAALTARCRGRITWGQVTRTLDGPLLVGLFGLAVGLGTLGRTWSGPADLLGHLDPWSTAAFGAGAAVAVNNLPAAALLGARLPSHPLSLLIGLNIGPNLSVTGSLAWVLWASAARSAGARPPIGRTLRAGLVSAPVAMALAVAALVLFGSHT